MIAAAAVVESRFMVFPPCEQERPSPSGEGMGGGACLAERFVLLDFPTPTPPLKGRG
ncbi:hypothetical protein ABIC17_004075 [Sphingomonas sp. PvP056]